MMRRFGQRGAVSLFIVIFTMLLITVVTVGFIQLMLRSQGNASTNDLSQSAYDSAMAGVQDAERALVLLKKCQQGIAPASVNCATLTNAITSGSCSTLSDAGMGITADGRGAVAIGNASDNQAYTCVKIITQTDAVEGKAAESQPVVIPLTAVGGAAFDTVKVSWFAHTDVCQITESCPADLPLAAEGVKLPPVSAWPATRPPLLRAQFVQTGGQQFTYDNFDSMKYSSTLFLKPVRAGVSSFGFDLDARRAAYESPQPVSCVTDYSAAGNYACTVTLRLPLPASNDAANRGTALLSLTTIYGGASYSVQMINSTSPTTPVKFDGVSPQVDSTGRASDVYRRVKASIRLDSPDGMYPDAAVSVNGNICKNFLVTDTEYIPGSLACNPATATP